MMGMAMLITSMAFVACSHESVYDENYANKEKELTYEQAFIQKYGKVSPNQDWDFMRSPEGARTRAAEGEVAAAAEGIPFGTSGFDWLWSYSDGTTGELPLADFDNLWKAKDAIKKAIEDAPSIEWNPSVYDNVVFRTFAVANDAGTPGNLKPYHRFGFSDGTHNYWLAEDYTNRGPWVDKGTLVMHEIRKIDFKNLPSISWFVLSQNSNNNSHKGKFYASEHKLTHYKEVTVKVKVQVTENRKKVNKEYTETFWAFNCTGAVNSNDNLILWVRPTYKTPEETPDTPDVPADVITAKRYMCEDLGGVKSSDIDFNDIVFDLIDTNGSQKCYVRAMGGTLDIAIKINGNVIFRKTTWQDPTFKKAQMYNTGWNGTIGVYDEINFEETLAEVEVSGWNPNTNNVSIVVYNPTETPAETIIDFPAIGAVPKMVAVDLQRKWKEEKAEVPDLGWFSDFERQ